MDTQGPWDLSEINISHEALFKKICARTAGVYKCITVTPNNFSSFFIIDTPWRGIKFEVKGGALHWSHSLPFFDTTNLILQIVIAFISLYLFILTVPILVVLYINNASKLKPILQIVGEIIANDDTKYNDTPYANPNQICENDVIDSTNDLSKAASSEAICEKENIQEMTVAKQLAKLEELYNLGVYAQCEFIERQKKLLGEENE